MPPIDRLGAELRKSESSMSPGMSAPPGVVYNVVKQSDRHRVLVHLLNYTLTPVENVRIMLKRKYRSAVLLSPDFAHAVPVAITQQTDHSSQVTIPRLKIYSLLVLTQ